MVGTDHLRSESTLSVPALPAGGARSVSCNPPAPPPRDRRLSTEACEQAQAPHRDVGTVPSTSGTCSAALAEWTGQVTRSGGDRQAGGHLSRGDTAVHPPLGMQLLGPQICWVFPRSGDPAVTIGGNGKPRSHFGKAPRDQAVPDPRIHSAVTKTPPRKDAHACSRLFRNSQSGHRGTVWVHPDDGRSFSDGGTNC